MIAFFGRFVTGGLKLQTVELSATVPRIFAVPSSCEVYEHGVNMIRLQPKFTMPWILVVATMLASIGCATLRPIAKSPIPTEDASEYFTVELHQRFGQPKVTAFPLVEGATVQSALEESGAISTYRKMNVEILRRVPETGRMLKLPVVYDTRNDHVKIEQDYALHPNDRVIVRPASNSALEKVVESLLGHGN